MKKLVCILALFLVTFSSIAQVDTIYATVYNDSVTIWHMNTFRNCGSLFDIQVDFDDYFITINEVDTGQLAYCMCYFNLSVTLASLEPGMYTVDVYGDDMDGGYFGRIYFEIGNSGFSYSMTDCLEMEKTDSSSIELLVNEDHLKVNWYNAFLNCCPELEWTTWFTTDTFHISLTDNGVCDCECFFNVSLQYGPFTPGTYVLDFLDGLYGYPEFTIIENKTDPQIISTYQSPCYDAQNTEQISLLENKFEVYPNPFSTNMTIEYVVNEPGIVRVEIYDVIGKSIILIDDEMCHHGKYTNNFNGSQLKPGVYFIRYQLNNTILTKKIVKEEL